MTTSESPLSVLALAYEIAKKTIRRYSHRFSPKKYTQPQFLACLVLKEFLKLDYRGLAALLSDTSDLRNAIDLTVVPHFTAFQKASKRLLRYPRAKRLLQATVRRAVAGHIVKGTVPLAAMDATGLESHHASAYYVRRMAKGGKSEQKNDVHAFPENGNPRRLQEPRHLGGRPRIRSRARCASFPHDVGSGPRGGRHRYHDG